LEQVAPDEIVVIQAPLSGKLNWYTTPGVKYQGFGRVTSYRKRDQYEFSRKVRFNDAAEGTVIGSIQYELPLDSPHLTEIHSRFGNQHSVENQLVKKVADKSVFMVGPLMSSRESYAARRAEFIQFAEDQIENGVYQTTQTDVQEIDPLTEEKRTITKVTIKTGADGQPLRREQAVLATFGINTFNFALDDIDYSDQVKKQIEDQQKATMAVQTAIARAKEAEQDAKTVEEQGKAAAAKSKWDQEVIKAKEVTQAQQRLEVAELKAKEAKQYEIAQLLKANADATYKRQVFEADGALAQKLETFERISERYAQAIENHQGPWVPSIVMGQSGSSNGGNAAVDLVNLLTTKTARDLALELQPK
jgi:hypothetical protein